MENDPETYAIIGAAMVVEFTQRRIPFARETAIPINYKGAVLPCGYRADFVCFGSILVELKAIQKLGSVEKAQVINYLKGTGFTRPLLLNFGASSLEYERIVLNHNLRQSA